MIDTIVFDFGGVLLDWNPEYLYKNSFKDEKELYYFLNTVCNAEWNRKQDEGRPFKEAIEELVIKFPQYKEHIEKYFTQWTDMIGGEIHENTSLIEGLKSKYRLFGLTNWSSETFPLVYNAYPFFKHLEGIVVSGEEKMLKPNLDIYNLLIERYSIIPHQTIFIDDTEDNIITAQKLGFHVIHYKKGVDVEAAIKALV